MRVDDWRIMPYTTVCKHGSLRRNIAEHIVYLQHGWDNYGTQNDIILTLATLVDYCPDPAPYKFIYSFIVTDVSNCHHGYLPFQH